MIVGSIPCWAGVSMEPWYIDHWYWSCYQRNQADSYISVKVMLDATQYNQPNSQAGCYHPFVATTPIVVGPLGTPIVQSRENLNSQPNWMIQCQNQPHSIPTKISPIHHQISLIPITKNPTLTKLSMRLLKIWKDFELKKVSGAEKIQLPSQFRLNNLGDE